jgi:hypothetical protein
MTVTINTNSIVSDTSLTLFNNTSTVVETLDTLGNALHPTRPSFKYHAGSTGNSQWSNYGSSLGKTHQIGSAFNLSNGRFTAPITGVYHFNINCMTNGSSGDSRLSLYRNGGDSLAKCIVVSTQANHHNNCGFGVTILLNAGDYVSPAMYSGSSAHADSWNTFSGYLVSELV